MPIFSYIAIPKSGAGEELSSDLHSLPHCQVISADNQDVFVLVTDTPDQTSEERLQKSLKNLPSLQSLSLAFGYDENEGK